MSGFIAVDTGGTFTDLVAYDPFAGRICFTKSLTTHHNPVEGILDCIGKADVSLEGASLFKHGTTLVVNTLIERSGPRIALVTTRGFRDVIDLGRGHRSDQYDLFFRREPSLVSRTLRLEIDERVDGQGRVLVAPDRGQVETLAQHIATLDVEAIAVSFLNSYLNPDHEVCVSTWLRELLPAMFVTAGTELSREWYEFERGTTATANAYTGPKVSRYVASLNEELKQRDFSGRLLIMGSNGGMLSPEHATRGPVTLVESGPIGGCIGAAIYGQMLDIPNLIAFDMGGTTAKCALVRDGKFDVVSTYYVGGYGRGLPIRTPVIDIVEVGAGGGSIASVDDQLRMRVGPRSAGSMPGPVCYGRGGLEPTVTDANLVLGRLNPARFQGGEMALDVEESRRAIKTKLADPLGYHGEEGIIHAANGVLGLAVVTMSSAIKRITVERGKDPRDFVMFSYGGGGPLHGVDLARELSIPRVMIPPEPGNFSAVGMLLADIRRDDGRMFLHRLDDEVLSPMATVFKTVEADLQRDLKQSFGDIAVRTERYAEMRYVGQFHTVRIRIDHNDSVSILKDFEREYESRFGHLIKGGRVEFVSLHVVIYGETPRPELSDICAVRSGQSAVNTTTRDVHFTQEGCVSATVYQRVDLAPGFTATGAALIEEYGSTTLIGPQDRFVVGKFGEIDIFVAPPTRTRGH